MITALVFSLLGVWFGIPLQRLCRQKGMSHRWRCFVPLLQYAPFFRLAGMSGWWVLSIILIPLGIVMMIIAAVRLARQFGESGLFSVVLFFPPLSIWGLYRLASRSQKTDNETPSVFDPATQDTFRQQRALVEADFLRPKYLEHGWTEEQFALLENTFLQNKSNRPAALNQGVSVLLGVGNLVILPVLMAGTIFLDVMILFGSSMKLLSAPAIMTAVEFSAENSKEEEKAETPTPEVTIEEVAFLVPADPTKTQAFGKEYWKYDYALQHPTGGHWLVVAKKESPKGENSDRWEFLGTENNSLFSTWEVPILKEDSTETYADFALQIDFYDCQNLSEEETCAEQAEASQPIKTEKWELQSTTDKKFPQLTLTKAAVMDAEATIEEDTDQAVEEAEAELPETVELPSAAKEEPADSKTEFSTENSEAVASEVEEKKNKEENPSHIDKNSESAEKEPGASINPNEILIRSSFGSKKREKGEYHFPYSLTNNSNKNLLLITHEKNGEEVKTNRSEFGKTKNIVWEVPEITPAKTDAYQDFLLEFVFYNCQGLTGEACLAQEQNSEPIHTSKWGIEIPLDDDAEMFEIAAENSAEETLELDSEQEIFISGSYRGLRGSKKYHFVYSLDKSSDDPRLVVVSQKSAEEVSTKHYELTSRTGLQWFVPILESEESDPYKDFSLEFVVYDCQGLTGEACLAQEQNSEPLETVKWGVRIPFDFFAKTFEIGAEEFSEDSSPASSKPDFSQLPNCDQFPDKLTACEAFTCQFIHPLMKETMQRSVVGLVDGKCEYQETMPNNGQMSCQYSTEVRSAVAQYYRDLANAESEEVRIQAGFGTSESKALYFINGKEVTNPVQTAMDNGSCQISGYGL